jgi:hypothetical protein
MEKNLQQLANQLTFYFIEDVFIRRVDFGKRQNRARLLSKSMGVSCCHFRENLLERLSAFPERTCLPKSKFPLGQASALLRRGFIGDRRRASGGSDSQGCKIGIVGFRLAADFLGWRTALGVQIDRPRP